MDYTKRMLFGQNQYTQGQSDFASAQNGNYDEAAEVGTVLSIPVRACGISVSAGFGPPGSDSAGTPARHDLCLTT